jgi:YHS domain-containing protein
MTRTLFIFLGTFAGGALVALVVRAAVFNQHAGHTPHAPVDADHAPMVSNGPAAPAAAAREAGSSAHAGHTAGAPAAKLPTASATRTAGSPVNSVCAICGMEVDPKLPTAEYQGKTIGFGCRMCPPKFKADPDRYGPVYLRNEVVQR